MNIVLLTSTIAPPKGIGSTTRLNILERENDYLISLEFYLNLLGKGIDKIIFAENSKHDLSKILKLIENIQTNIIEIHCCPEKIFKIPIIELNISYLQG